MKTILVTGANRGIGLGICRLLLNQKSPINLHATSRSGTDLNLPSDPHKIHYSSLDITSSSSISAVPPVDILINNAGINLDANFTPTNARTTIDVNYRGTRDMCLKVLPSMSPGSRIVNVSSIASQLKIFSSELAQRLRNVKSVSEVDGLAEEYLADVDAKRDVERGWPAVRSYCVSKALVNALTRVLARENQGVLVNCCCPGWVATDMGRIVGRPPKTEEEGARIPVRLAVGDLEGVSGEYWANDGVRGKEDGKVQQW